MTPLTSAAKMSARRAELNRLAIERGWRNWYAVETAIYNGVMSIPRKPIRHVEQQSHTPKDTAQH